MNTPELLLMSESFRPLLLIGSSVRAAATSAVLAGFKVFAIDRFGDTDLQRLATVVPISNWPGDVGDAVQRLPVMPWMYCGSMENELELVARVSRHHPLLGNDPDVLKLIRNPFWVEATLTARDLPTLRHLAVTNAPRDGEWLIKPIRSGGGHGIFVFGRDLTTDDNYLQEFRRGRSISALFVAAKCDIELIGISEQLIGREFGAPTDFGYAGSIGPISVPNQTNQLIKRIGHELAQAAELRGLFGIDFILADDVPWLTEINPRYTASAEVYERAWGRSLVAEHVGACDRGQVFKKCHFGNHDPRRVVGKRVVYAAADSIAPDLEVESSGLAEFIADIPVPGSHIAAGWPVCTVFATGASEFALKSALQDRTDAVCRLVF